MSVWYQYEVEILGTYSSIAKFLNLDPTKDVRTDRIEFSFGGKNAPGLRLYKIIEQNPDCIFITKEIVECSTKQYDLLKYYPETNILKKIFIHSDCEFSGARINKKLLEEYDEKFNGLSAKHFQRYSGFENFRWSNFFNYDSAKNTLDNSDQYKEIIDCQSTHSSFESNLEYDNDISHWDY